MGREVSKRMGNWKTAAMVDRYAKLSDKRLREGAAVVAKLADEA